MSFSARFPGECVTCDEPITPGQQVKYEGRFSDRRLAHTACPELEPAVGQIEGVR